jgi:hypothetical protein
MAKTQEYSLCPLCHLSTTIDRRLELLSKDQSDEFIQVRDTTGGRTKDGKSHGFPKVGSMTLHEAVSSGNYTEVLDLTKKQLLRVLKAFRDEGVISKEDLNQIK